MMIRPIVRHWLFVFLLLATLNLDAQAGRPKTPPPTPDPPAAGMVFFRDLLQDSIYQMRADGSELATVIPAAMWDAIDLSLPPGHSVGRQPVPSNLLYGGEHWWLQVEEIHDGKRYPGTPVNPLGSPRRELVVFQVVTDEQNNVSRIAITLTNLFDQGIAPLSAGADAPTAIWSNDGIDSFVSVAGKYFSNDPNAPADPTLYVFQVPLAFDSYGIPAANIASLHTTRIPVEQYHGCSWSPDGTEIVFQVTDWGNNKPRLQRHSALAAAVGLAPSVLWTHPGTSGSELDPQWAPVAVPGGKSIVFATHLSTLERAVLTVSPVDSTTQTVLPAASKTGYWNPQWAPLDASQLVLEQYVVGRKSTTYSLVRCNPDGSGLVTLLGPQTTGRKLIAWRIGIEAP